MKNLSDGYVKGLLANKGIPPTAENIMKKRKELQYRRTTYQSMTVDDTVVQKAKALFQLKEVEQCTNRYISHLLRVDGLESKDITMEMVEEKRRKVQVRRTPEQIAARAMKISQLEAEISQLNAG